MRIFIALFLSCIVSGTAQSNQEKTTVNNVLEQWHHAAATANFNGYFDLMTDDSIFIGTDATENWNYDEFKAFSKPYFDKGKAWSFKTLERNIFFNSREDIAWFDEHLSTQMGICRGSGVLVKKDDRWKIQHYVLSIAVPNENVQSLTALKKNWDDAHIKKLSEN